ncbi:MAG: twin-arginine translocation signal domain-containing protein, partial [Sphingorhabdus sp.]|uniref:twin-arginine translocation signal domain-containing protein n=1 Tax=Sphingorhabdus sp. TaxID=1902408 RepID=UPI003C971752
MTDMERRTVIKTALAVGAAATLPGPATASDKPLAGKSMLITGASSGFGYLGALHYARLGAKVIASMRGLSRKEAD